MFKNVNKGDKNFFSYHRSMTKLYSGKANGEGTLASIYSALQWIVLPQNKHQEIASFQFSALNICLTSTITSQPIIRNHCTFFSCWAFFSISPLRFSLFMLFFYSLTAMTHGKNSLGIGNCENSDQQIPKFGGKITKVNQCFL